MVRSPSTAGAAASMEWILTGLQIYGLILSILKILPILCIFCRIKYSFYFIVPWYLISQFHTTLLIESATQSYLLYLFLSLAMQTGAGRRKGDRRRLTGRNLAAGSSSFSGLLCVVISAYLITRGFICCHTRCSRYNHLLPLALKLLWILSTSAF